MPRPPRADEAGAIYHALNRGNARQRVFKKDEDYLAFERVLLEGLDKHSVDLLAFQWMPNHWHMILSPRKDGEMSKLMYWVTMTHAARHHAHYKTTGTGHLYQGRYKSFPVQSDDHYFAVCRYVERNALAANLVSRAEDWRWGSLSAWCNGGSQITLAKWPMARRPGWIDRVNESVSDEETKKIQKAIARSRPLGDEAWVETTARRLNLESTLRKRGRPRKIT